MPIDDERRRLGRAKAAPGVDPPSATSTKHESAPKDRAQESMQRLHEMLLLQRDERAEFRAEEEKRIETNEQAAQRARNERNEKYERLQQAFARMNRWKDEEKTEAAREESKLVQGTSRVYLISAETPHGVADVS